MSVGPRSVINRSSLRRDQRSTLSVVVWRLWSRWSPPPIPTFCRMQLTIRNMVMDGWMDMLLSFGKVPSVRSAFQPRTGLGPTAGMGHGFTLTWVRGHTTYQRVLFPSVMVLLLLLQAALPALWRMDCLVSGRNILSLGEAESCMPYEAHGPTDELDVSCCVFSVTSGERHEFLKTPLRTPLVIPFFVVKYATEWNASSPALVTVIQRDHPPPKGVEDIPVSFRRLLI